MYKKGANGGNAILWIVVIVGVYLVATGGFDIGGLFSGGGDAPKITYPSTMKTSITLNTGDELATSATAANVSYYVFDDEGNYLKEGTTSSGSASFNVPVAGNYQLIVYDDTSSTAVLDYLPVYMEFSTNGGDLSQAAEKTVNVDLKKESNITIDAVQDPIDLNTNLSNSAGSTSVFDVLISTEISNAAAYKPVLRFISNTSCVESMVVSNAEKVECPDRLTTVGLQEDRCFQVTDRDYLMASDGIVDYRVSVDIDDSNACPSNSAPSNVTVSVIDTGLYIEADYKTQGISAFKEGTEKPTDNSNLGSGDSAITEIYWA